MIDFIKLHWKTLTGLVCLSIVVVIFVIGKVFNLEWINNTITYYIEILLALGFVTYFELNEIMLWYNRWILKKYKLRDTLTLKFKYYDANFKSKLSEVDAIIKHIVFTNNQSLIYEIALLENNHILDNVFIYAKLNPITNGVTLVTSTGESYKPKIYQYDQALGLDIDLAVKDFFKYSNRDVRCISIDSISCKKK